jgi:hypothetical protein
MGFRLGSIFKTSTEMIKDFEIYIPSTDISYLVKGKLVENSWQNESFRKLFAHHRKAIRWTFEDKHCVFENAEGKIQGYISPDWRYVLATHYKTPGIDTPRNAVVYNADGSVHLFLVPEKLLIHHPKEKCEFYLSGMAFNSVRWMKNSKDKTVLVIEVLFPDRITEFWEVDPETGEFGERISYWREK